MLKLNVKDDLICHSLPNLYSKNNKIIFSCGFIHTLL